MTIRKLNGPLGGDYVTDGQGNAVLLTESPITAADSLVWLSHREPEAWSDFRSASDGQPTVLDSGQAWRYTANGGESHEPIVADGALTNDIVSGGTAGYAEVHLNGTVSRTGAKVTFSSYSDDTGGAAFGILSAPFDNSDIPTMACHLVVTPEKYDFGVWENPGTLVPLQQRYFPVPLTADDETEHTIEVQIVGNTAYLMMPDGITGQVTDDRIATNGGGYAFWEVFASDAATGSKVRFCEVWADSRVDSFRATGASLATVIEALSGRPEITARVYAGTDADVTLTGTHQELNTALRTPIIFPPSGQLLVEFNGYLVATSGTAVILTIFYDAALSQTAQTHWVTKGNTTYDGNFHTSAIVSNSPGSSGTFYVAAWRVSGTAVMYLGSNNPAVLKVTSL